MGVTKSTYWGNQEAQGRGVKILFGLLYPVGGDLHVGLNKGGGRGLLIA